MEIATIYRKKDTHVHLMNVMGTVVSYTYTPYDLNAIDADMAAFLHYINGRSYKKEDIPVLRRLVAQKEWGIDTFAQCTISLTVIQKSRLKKIFYSQGSSVS